MDQLESSIQLTVVQQPREALVTQLGKEKMRKPIDPPPVVQMVLPTDKDPQQIYTHSPYLYCLATLVEEHSLNPVTDSKGVTVLLGTIVSSINRLKDNRDNESAFFVFADMSVRKQGRFRLLFSVFETKPHEGTTIFVKNVVSNTFKVVASKDYSGLEESTAMSRTFADQGVKLRLRKETRGSTSRKRERDDGDDEKPRRARQETKRARSDERRDDNIYASNTWTSPQQPATQQYHNTLDSIQCTVPQTVTAYENPNNYPLVARQTNTDIGDCQQAILQRQMWRYY
ncbi:hypothetical protein EJ05DRAFT_479234 [Pseudovirgaria hyperparasitica]|uniref:Velvet domain-containing protein n=1 Tax=Pseudovirgaria hyperparasitica TaxID=470096 RepID=A0A6A6VW56_9PEZI|nr:uncharacterized protein EJ05DRAFT_479234 [Pseudovirgaria hyperparasitica]KAF2754822.1 hypothetical protein EJ05DRAFT_479234 [Pseudovirgaria hyperparasitica]